MITHSVLHYTIVRHFVDHGIAPSLDALSSMLDHSLDEVVTALRSLTDYHGVVLHPNSAEVWAIRSTTGALVMA